MALPKEGQLDTIVEQVSEIGVIVDRWSFGEQGECSLWQHGNTWRVVLNSDLSQKTQCRQLLHLATHHLSERGKMDVTGPRYETIKGVMDHRI